jgi:hypothetical protein
VPPEAIRLRNIVSEGLHFLYLNKTKEAFGKIFPSGRFQYSLTLVTIARNEAEYIVEWIEYRLYLGVEKIYIYDNESSDHLKEVIASYIDEGLV